MTATTYKVIYLNVIIFPVVHKILVTSSSQEVDTSIPTAYIYSKENLITDCKKKNLVAKQGCDNDYHLKHSLSVKFRQDCFLMPFEISLTLPAKAFLQYPIKTWLYSDKCIPYIVFSSAKANWFIAYKTFLFCFVVALGPKQVIF